MDVPFVGFQKKNAYVINTPAVTGCRNVVKHLIVIVYIITSYIVYIYKNHWILPSMF
jgi:hypothetical protein